jgi:hypothetical protein
VSYDLPKLREALQSTVNHEDEEFDGAVLTGYVVIAEWAKPDGTRWLTKTAGDLNDEGPGVWTVKGWLYHALDTAQRDADLYGDDDD